MGMLCDAHTEEDCLFCSLDDTIAERNNTIKELNSEIVQLNLRLGCVQEDYRKADLAAAGARIDIRVLRKLLTESDVQLSALQKNFKHLYQSAVTGHHAADWGHPEDGEKFAKAIERAAGIITEFSPEENSPHTELYKQMAADLLYDIEGSAPDVDMGHVLAFIEKLRRLK